MKGSGVCREINLKKKQKFYYEKQLAQSTTCITTISLIQIDTIPCDLINEYVEMIIFFVVKIMSHFHVKTNLILLNQLKI